jgi:hypothetical protein
MLRKSNIDSDPNSIYGASKKLATISVRNMKNISDNPDMQLGLDQLPASTLSAQQPTSNTPSMVSSFVPNNVSKFKPSKNVSFFPQQSNRTILNNYSSDVDTFLSLISDTNSNLQNLDLLLDSHYHPGQREDIKQNEERQRLIDQFKNGAIMNDGIMNWLYQDGWDFNNVNTFVKAHISSESIPQNMTTAYYLKFIFGMNEKDRKSVV